MNCANNKHENRMLKPPSVIIMVLTYFRDFESHFLGIVWILGLKTFQHFFNYHRINLEKKTEFRKPHFPPSSDIYYLILLNSNATSSIFQFIWKHHAFEFCTFQSFIVSRRYLAYIVPPTTYL